MILPKAWRGNDKMFGISGAEFIVILMIAIAVIPAKQWPAVARFFGRAIRYMRDVAGKIQDGIDSMEDEIAKDLPIDNLSQKTMDDMIETFSTPAKPRTRKKK
jgi:Sec-independent protein translocase protein TatA